MVGGAKIGFPAMLRAWLQVVIPASCIVCFSHSSIAQTNLLQSGTLEDYGTQKDSGNKAAANVHDGSTSTRWESNKLTQQEYFIFSFSGGASCGFSAFNLYNKNDNKAVKYFQLMYSSSSSAATDPDDSSWQAISPSGSFTTEKVNLINIRLGATLEDFGTEKDSNHSAEMVADGSTKTKWESEKNSTNDYFIFSFPSESVEQPDSFVLFNDNSKGVKKFELYYSSDPSAKNDPNHSSWVQINGTFDANKTSSAQSYNFTSVSCRYFLFKITDQYKNDRVKIAELELYGTKTLGQAGVWKAEQTSSLQAFSFNQVAGKYFLFKIGGNYGDDKDSVYEIELMGSQSGYEILQWREVIQ